MLKSTFMTVRFKIITLSVFAAVLVWTLDAAIDAFVFREGRFPDILLFNVTPHALHFRLLFLASFIIFGVILSGIMSGRLQTEDALRASREALLTVTATARDAIVMMDPEGNISFWNPAAERMFGHKSYEAIGRELHALLGPGRHYETYKQGFTRFKDTGNGPAVGRTIELTAVRKDGSEFPVELSLTAFQLKGRWYATGIIRDITERKKTESELKDHRRQLEEMVRERTAELTAANERLQQEVGERKRQEEKHQRSEKFLNTIFDSIRDPFSIVDRNFRIIRLNDAYAQMRGRSQAELIGNKCYEVLRKRAGVCDDCVVEKSFNSGDPCAKEKLLAFPDGAEVWVEIYTYPILSRSGRVSHVIEYTRDITDRKKSENERKILIEKLEYLSTTDSLTTLLNRRALISVIEREMDRARRYGSELSLMLCDIDNLKEINDSFGHMAGDKALQTISDTVRGSLRKSDIVGRHGGDEFMLILPETPVEGARNIAEKIRSAVEHAVFSPVENNQTRVTLSIGVTCYGAHDKDADSLVKRSDQALYTAKHSGKNRVAVLTP